MLLTLSTGSLRACIGRDGKGSMTLLDVPEFAIKQLGLRGLNLPASMLAGLSLTDLDALRDRADKAACPCLVLIQDEPLPLAHPDDKTQAEAVARVRKLAFAANRLGCNALALRCQAEDTEDDLDLTATEIRAMMPAIERLELIVLIAPTAGLTSTTTRLTDLIKRVGGFRIGSLPSFADAAASGGGDPTEPLRKLAPYAGAIQATVEGFNRKGAHKSYDLASCVATVRSVGFLNTLAIDYTGDADPVANIEKARDILQAAIDAEPA